MVMCTTNTSEVSNVSRAIIISVFILWSQVRETSFEIPVWAAEGGDTRAGKACSRLQKWDSAPPECIAPHTFEDLRSLSWHTGGNIQLRPIHLESNEKQNAATGWTHTGRKWFSFYMTAAQTELHSSSSHKTVFRDSKQKHSTQTQ